MHLHVLRTKYQGKSDGVAHFHHRLTHSLQHSPRVTLATGTCNPFLASFVLNVCFICCKAHTTFTVINVIELRLHSCCLLLWWLHFTPSIKGTTGSPYAHPVTRTKGGQREQFLESAQQATHQRVWCRSTHLS